MTGFLERLIGRAQGRLRVVQPLLPSRYAPGAALPADGGQPLVDPFSGAGEDWPGETASELERMDRPPTRATLTPQPATAPAGEVRNGRGNAPATGRGQREDGGQAPEARGAGIPLDTDAPDAERPQPVPRSRAGSPAPQHNDAARQQSERVRADAGRASTEATAGPVAAPAPAARPSAAMRATPETAFQRERPTATAPSDDQGATAPAPAAPRPDGRRASMPPPSPVEQATSALARLTAPHAIHEEVARVAAPSPAPPAIPGAPATPDSLFDGQPGPAPERLRATAPAGPERAGRSAMPPYLPALVPASGRGGIPAGGRRAAPAMPPGEPAPQVRVTIGRIDVRAVQPVSPPQPQPAQQAEPLLSLDAYLKQRSDGRA